jgi:hypothetical protein
MICTNKPEKPSFGHLFTPVTENISITPIIPVAPKGGALQTTSTIGRFDTKITLILLLQIHLRSFRKKPPWPYAKSPQTNPSIR